MTQTRKTELVLEEFLPYKLAILSNFISRSISEIYEDRYQLSIPEWRVMAVVGRFPGSSAVDVAERTLMDKVAVSRAVAKLINSGRVQRQIAATDKRRSVLSLTQQGETIYKEVAPLALRFEERLLEGLDNKDLDTFTQVLEQLLKRTEYLSLPRSTRPSGKRDFPSK